jgi:hypothetical protein
MNRLTTVDTAAEAGLLYQLSPTLYSSMTGGFFFSFLNVFHTD